MTLDATAPPTEPGMLDVGAPAAGGILDLDTGAAAPFRSVALLNTAESGMPLGAASSAARHTWMESSGRFVFGGTSDASTLAGGAIGAHANDSAVSISLTAASVGRGALASVGSTSGSRSYFLAVAHEGGTVSRRSWQCGEADATCFEDTPDVIGSHDGEPLLDATPLAPTHIGLVSARTRAGTSDAQEVVLHVVPWDPARGTGVDGIPLLTTRQHGIAIPRIRGLAVSSTAGGDGNVTLLLASVVERPTGEQAVWATALRFCSAP